MNKTVFITGASRGIGSTCAEVLAKDGYNVAIGYCRNKEKAECLAQKLQNLGLVAKAFHIDVSVPKSVDACIDRKSVV